MHVGAKREIRVEKLTVWVDKDRGCLRVSLRVVVRLCVKRCTGGRTDLIKGALTQMESMPICSSSIAGTNPNPMD